MSTTDPCLHRVARQGSKVRGDVGRVVAEPISIGARSVLVVHASLHRLETYRLRRSGRSLACAGQRVAKRTSPATKFAAGRSRFSSLFNVAAIGGKSPRLRLCRQCSGADWRGQSRGGVERMKATTRLTCTENMRQPNDSVVAAITPPAVPPSDSRSPHDALGSNPPPPRPARSRSPPQTTPAGLLPTYRTAWARPTVVPQMR